MPLPPALIAATIVRQGRVAIVIGAGTSVESPTALPTSRQCCHAAYHELIQAGILPEGRCDDPGDLAKVADAVVAVTGSQDLLVAALPVDRFRAPAPNKGHLVAGALLRERAVSAIVTLNFDIAMTIAV